MKEETDELTMYRFVDLFSLQRNTNNLSPKIRAEDLIDCGGEKATKGGQINKKIPKKRKPKPHQKPQWKKNKE